jgi:diguanylate cyclase (GGDEF)-like protein
MSEEGKKESFPILVAEDNAVYRRLLKKTLAKAGYKVAVVENGSQALDLFNKTFFPMVISDWTMPRMNGIELCEAIRRLPVSGYVYIIFLTAKDSKHDVIAALDAGADDYLTKPFSHAELTARLRTGRRVLALERSLKQANEEITLLSITDHLTKCFNRGYAMNHIPKEITRTVRYRHHLSLIMFDIDHFKKVNDSYGHLAGDEVLKQVVDCVTGGIRQGIDWIARYGGEEFLVILPETDSQGALVAAERLRRMVAERVIRAEDKDITVTASFGIAYFDPSIDKETSPEELIREADTCLYRAKNEGRNRVKSRQKKGAHIQKVSSQR